MRPSTLCSPARMTSPRRVEADSDFHGNEYHTGQKVMPHHVSASFSNVGFRLRAYSSTGPFNHSPVKMVEKRILRHHRRSMNYANHQCPFQSRFAKRVSKPPARSCRLVHSVGSAVKGAWELEWCMRRFPALRHSLGSAWYFVSSNEDRSEDTCIKSCSSRSVITIGSGHRCLIFQCSMLAVGSNLSNVRLKD